MAGPEKRGDFEIGDAPQDPPLQALYPNLDRVSRSAFRKGTVSRRRITAAALGLVVVSAVIAGLLLVSTLG